MTQNNNYDFGGPGIEVFRFLQYALVCKEHFAKSRTNNSIICRTTYYVFGIPLWRAYVWHSRELTKSQ